MKVQLVLSLYERRKPQIIVYNYDRYKSVQGPVKSLDARVRALCSGIEKDIVQTPWCLRSNRVLVRQLSARHFVYCIAGKAWRKSVGTNKILFGVQTSDRAKVQCPSTTR